MINVYIFVKKKNNIKYPTRYSIKVGNDSKQVLDTYPNQVEM